MANLLSQCISSSELVGSNNILPMSRRPSLRVIPYIASFASNASCDNILDTILYRDSHRKLVLPYNPLRISRVLMLILLILLLACVGPVWYSGWAEQNRGGNGAEKSASGGYNPGADVFGALDSLEKGHSHLEPYSRRRKRGPGDHPQPWKTGSRRKKAARQRFACHYYLHDRIGHSECLNKRLIRLSDVRQHLLERTHKQQVHCPVCGVAFPGRTPALARQQREAHIRAATCEHVPSLPSFPGITEDQEERIKQIAANCRGNRYTEVQRWYLIWEVLFPGEPRPDSPFLTEVPEIQRMIDHREALFGGDLWLNLLPNEPSLTAMPPGVQRSTMYDIVGAFIGQAARGVAQQSESSVEDDLVIEDVSQIGAETPDPPGAPAVNMAVMFLRNSSSNTPVRPPAQTHWPVGPHSVTRPAQVPPNLHTPDQMVSNPSELPAVVVASVPSQSTNNPAMDVPQGPQQPAGPGPAADMNDPTILPSALEPDPEPATGDFDMDFDDFDWQSFIAGNDIARQGNDSANAGEDEFGAHH
ncbi:hypothetical protein Daus18300_011558 [Diaporthe australafricana]|uniref:C2H2-type domain-containing protein n=1 Tax=Diaporthe australafricana TaxID=127596 RepID=A0ABR3W6F9_9PEZI